MWDIYTEMMPLLSALLLLVSVNIVRRADVADARYLELGSQFPAVMSLGSAGDGTLIGNQWLLTAAHVARALERRATLPTITIGAARYRVDRVVIHPSWIERGPHDIGLVHVSGVVRGVK